MRAVESGLEWDDVAERVSELKAQRAKAETDIVAWSTVTKVDPEDFADFLQRGADLSEKDLLDAFVRQVIVGEEDVTVILNYDVNENEPARFTLAGSNKKTLVAQQCFLSNGKRLLK